MPPRFRRPEPMTTFELVPDDERDDGRDDDGPLRPGDDDGSHGRRLATLRDLAAGRWRGLSRRGRGLVAAAAAVVVVGAATAVVLPGRLDAHAERARAEAVRGMPGAVDDLSEPLTPTWELTDGGGILTVLTGGALLVNDGASVRAVDAATGTGLWAHELGPDPVCGPSPVFVTDWTRAPDLVVCLTGKPGERAATVLDAEGTVVGTRDLGAVSDPVSGPSPRTPRVWPAGDGTIAVVDPTPDVSASAAPDAPAAETLRALHAAGWEDPTLRIEDAITGEVRAEATARLRAEDLDGCGTTQDGDNEPELMLDPYVWASTSRTVLTVCGASAGIDADGTAHDKAEAAGWAQPLPGGGSVIADETSTYLDAEGAVVATVPGYAQPPMVDDEPDGPYLTLTLEEDADAEDVLLTASSHDGERLWTSPADGFSSVLARVAGTVVVNDGERLVGLDAGTGAERWARDDVLDIAHSGTGEWVAGVVTDGTRVLLGIGGDPQVGRRLVALDVRDGRTTWERTDVGDLGNLVAVEGHPLLISTSSATVRGLG